MARTEKATTIIEQDIKSREISDTEKTASDISALITETTTSKQLLNNKTNSVNYDIMYKDGKVIASKPIYN